jgi:predicted TIM-barrel fold metal-dependent hydrolase
VTTLRIDCHTHVWPDAIAAKALAPAVPEVPRRGDGRVATLAEAMDAAGIDRCVCLGVADGPNRVEAANRFAGSLAADRFIGFGSIHPDWSPEDIVANLRANNLKGIKLHPHYQFYALDDPRIEAILDALGDEFVVLTHVGAGQNTPNTEGNCTPDKLRRIIDNFPRLRLIAAHFGGYRMFESAMELVAGLPVYVDTSWPPGLASLVPQEVRRYIERHGPDRVVFGSDWPMADPIAEIEAIQRLGLTADETEGILGGNLARLLGMP